MNAVLLHTITQIDANYVLQTHSTNPLLRAGTISSGIREFLSALPHYDSLFSVTRRQVRLWDASAKPINHDPNVLLRTQDLPPVYEENSCVYLFPRSMLEERGNRIGERPLLFPIDPTEAIDIDEEVDFQFAELAFSHRERMELGT